MKLFQQRQADQGAAGCRGDIGDCPVEMRGIRRSGNEPEVPGVFTFVVVIDLCISTDLVGHSVELSDRHCQRRQGAGTNAARRKNCANTTDYTLCLQLSQRREYAVFGDIQAPRQLGVRCYLKWKVALKFIEQAKFKFLVQKPILAAREVKNMPEGAFTGISPMRAKLAVS